MIRLLPVLCLAATAPIALAQDADAPPPKSDVPCVTTGSPSVFVEGRPMLRLSDVATCDPRTYEIIPGLTVNGEPAVRLLPDPESGDAPTSAQSVFMGDEPASRLGDER